MRAKTHQTPLKAEADNLHWNTGEMTKPCLSISTLKFANTKQDCKVNKEGWKTILNTTWEKSQKVGYFGQLCCRQETVEPEFLHVRSVHISVCLRPEYYQLPFIKPEAQGLLTELHEAHETCYSA